MKNKIIAFILTFIIFLSSVPFTSLAYGDTVLNFDDIKVNVDTEEPPKADSIKDEITFHPMYSGHRSSLDYYYQDEYFMSPSDKYNKHLSTLSMLLSMIWTSSVRAGDVRYGKLSLLLDMGFKNIESSPDMAVEPNPDTVGLIMAEKNIFYGGEEYTLVAISYRGGGYGSEWANNFVVGSKEECYGGHLGFHNARDRSLEFILDYLERNVSGKVKLWISGFSRGGAVSGLTGAWFNDNIASLSKYGIYAEKDDIFTYTFEAPSSMDKELNSEKKYGNIFNIVSSDDIIPLLPFELWGFERPGITKYLPTLTGEDVDTVNKILSDIGSGYRYEYHLFSPVASTVGTTHSEFIRNLCNVFAKRMDRALYAECVQDTFAYIMDRLLNAGNDEMDLLVYVFSEKTFDALGIEWDENGNGQLMLLIIELVKNDKKAMAKLCDAVGNNLKEAGFIEAYDETVKEALNTTLSILLTTEDGISIIPYAVTMMNNTSVDRGHIPDSVLAMLICQDSYYSSSPAIEWSQGRFANEDTVSVTVNNGKENRKLDLRKGTTLTLSADFPSCVEFEGWYLNGELADTGTSCTFVVNEVSIVMASSKTTHKALGDFTVDSAPILFWQGSRSAECAECGRKYVEQIDAPIDLTNPIALTVSLAVILAVLAVSAASVSAVKKKKHKADPEKYENESA